MQLSIRRIPTRAALAPTLPAVSLNQNIGDVAMSVVPSRDRITSDSITGWISLPWFDRLVATVACVPFGFSLSHEIRTFGPNPAWIITNANFILLVLAMLVRRPPERVTPQPAFWLLAFVATYWLFIMGRFATAGSPLAP